jgi:hypothetical protein
MSLDITALLDLWTQPHRDRAQAVSAFRELYTDPVRVNGAELTCDDLVQRAWNLQAALADVQREVLDVCDAGEKVAIAFRLTGRHIGPLATSAGTLPAMGERIALRVIDILSLTEGRIAAITMVADEFGALAPINAAVLVGAGSR